MTTVTAQIALESGPVAKLPKIWKLHELLSLPEGSVPLFAVDRETNCWKAELILCGPPVALRVDNSILCVFKKLRYTLEENMDGGII